MGLPIRRCHVSRQVLGGRRFGFAVGTALAGAGVMAPAAATAGSVSGHLELPAAPERAPLATRGFLDRTENQLTPVRPVATTPWLLVVLEPEAPLVGGAPPPQVNWELVGESFDKPVVGAQAGAVIEIRNRSTTPRTFAVAGQPKLIDGGPINPTGVRDFHPAGAGVLQIADADAPHLRGTVVVVASPYFTNPDATGKFDFGEVADGNYKVRVFYRDHWIERADDPISVTAKSRVDVAAKIPAGYPGK